MNSDFTHSAHWLMLGGGVDFVPVAVGVLLASLLLLDDPTDVILELIEKTLVLPDSQREVHCSDVLGGSEVSAVREGNATYNRANVQYRLKLQMFSIHFTNKDL